MPVYSSYGMLDDHRVFSYDSDKRHFYSPFEKQDSLSKVWSDLQHCTAFKTDYLSRFVQQANTTAGLQGMSTMPMLHHTR